MMVIPRALVHLMSASQPENIRPKVLDIPTIEIKKWASGLDSPACPAIWNMNMFDNNPLFINILLVGMCSQYRWPLHWEYWPRSSEENEHHPTISNQVETVQILCYCCFLAFVASSSYWAPWQGQRQHNRGRAQQVPGYNLSSQTDQVRRTSKEQLGKCQLQIHRHRSLANSLKQHNMCFIKTSHLLQTRVWSWSTLPQQPLPGHTQTPNQSQLTVRK